MKKVLFFAYDYPPLGGGGVLRSVKFIKYLSDFGWEPIVITSKENAVGVKDATLFDDIPGNIRHYRVKAITPYLFFRALRRLKLTPLRHYLDTRFCIPDKMLGWTPFAVKQAQKIISEEHIDLIYTTSPPHSTHLIGKHLKKKFPSIPWVADFRDAFCENPFRVVKPGGLRDKIEQKLERKFIKRADSLIFNTHSSLNTHKNKYGDVLLQKSFVIPNGYDSEDFRNLPKYSHDARFTILHTGRIYGIRSIAPLVHALELFTDRHKKDQYKLKIQFIGYAINKDEKTMVAASKVRHLFEFRDFLSHDACLAEMKNADLLLLITGKGESEVMIPGKFYEYLGAGVPVLALSEKGELTKILQECNAGEWCSLDDYEKIAKTIHKFYANRNNKSFFKPDNAMITRYERKNLTEQLANIFNRLAP